VERKFISEEKWHFFFRETYFIKDNDSGLANALKKSTEEEDFFSAILRSRGGNPFLGREGESKKSEEGGGGGGRC